MNGEPFRAWLTVARSTGVITAAFEDEAGANASPRAYHDTVIPVIEVGTVLTAAMDNVDASRIGQIMGEVIAAQHRDSIDNGLMLHRLLEENGYLLLKK